MNLRSIHLLSLIAGVSFLTSCQQKNEEGQQNITPGLEVFDGQSGTIDIAGGTAHIPVMKKAAKEIMTAFPDIRITIAGGGSGVGAQQVGKGLVDIGNTGRALKESEAALGLVSHPFAIDGVAIIVHPDNPVTNLSSEQVASIYAGSVTNWKEVGGPDQEIHLFTRDEASGTRSVFVKKLLKKGAVIDSSNVVASNGAMKTAVTADKAAIGYCSIGYIDDMVKAPHLDNIEPSNANCVTGKYPVMRKLYMNTKGEPEGLVKTFIDFLLSKNANSYIETSGYIPLHAGE